MRLPTGPVPFRRKEGGCCSRAAASGGGAARRRQLEGQATELEALTEPVMHSRHQPIFACSFCASLATGSRRMIFVSAGRCNRQQLAERTSLSAAACLYMFGICLPSGQVTEGGK